MKRLLAWLVWLYPKPWRERYSDEIGALFEDMQPRWSDVWNLAGRGLWERSISVKAWQWIAVGALAGFSAHLAAMYVHHPDGYSSRAVLRVSGGLDLEKQVQGVAQSVLSRRTMEELIHTYGVDTGNKTMKDAAESLAGQVSILPARRPGDAKMTGFSINVLADKPELAQKMSRDLMTRFIDQNLRIAVQNGTQNEAAFSKGATMEVVNMPTLPERPVRWSNAEDVLGHGALFGAAVGLLVALGVAGWRRWRTQ